MTIAVRAASGPPERLASTLRDAVTSIDSELALSSSGTMEVFARNSIARERLSASLMGALAALALALAVLGVYGVMSYSVQVRRQEMGVRLALSSCPHARPVADRDRSCSRTGAGTGRQSRTRKPALPDAPVGSCGVWRHGARPWHHGLHRLRASGTARGKRGSVGGASV